MKYKKTVERKSNCVCGKCHRAFDFSEAKVVKIKLYSLEREQKVCPYCGFEGFTRTDHRYFLDNKQYKKGNN